MAVLPDSVLNRITLVGDDAASVMTIECTEITPAAESFELTFSVEHLTL